MILVIRICISPFYGKYIRHKTQQTTNIFQPGHLRGNIHRFDILLADMASIFVDPFLYGPLKKFRSISAKAVAKQVVNNSFNVKSGINYFDFKDFDHWR